jgi:ribosomal protein S18 acetylase RimI-like enzyme
MNKFSLIEENNNFVDINSIKLNSELIYLTEGGKQVGSLIMCFTEGKASIFSVSVLEKYRGKGYSKKLMKHAIDIAKKRGYSIMELNTEVTNEVANNLYRDLGFQLKGMLDGFNSYHLLLN